ncbi:hypothetical protein T492DRAFT_994867 [Pavlovales sp. CCMP2436]|nr:hypothetical protein T492DRAFT_994867 [Pavlovales sp. CCMP2436]|mmetsp:Transcript_7646/g.20051  ORF Transcript_7646/g.20051 Transcript_7646/m.20051 type:complete len:172 (+) Transcript_7646:44-559(+)
MAARLRFARVGRARWLSTGAGAADAGEVLAPSKPLISREMGVMLSMSTWGIYCAFRLMRAKSQFVEELLELEQDVDDAQKRADGFARENARLAALIDEARSTIATAGVLSIGTSARVLRILEAGESGVAPNQASGAASAPKAAKGAVSARTAPPAPAGAVAPATKKISTTW